MKRVKAYKAGTKMAAPDCLHCGAEMVAAKSNQYRCDDCKRVVQWFESTFERLARKTWPTTGTHAFQVIKKGAAPCQTQ